MAQKWESAPIVKPAAAVRNVPASDARGAVEFAEPVAPTSPLDLKRTQLAEQAETRQTAISTWRNLSPEETQRLGLPAGPVYQANSAGEIKAIAGTASEKPRPQEIAQNMLKSIGIDLSSKSDPVERLIIGSTSGMLERVGADVFGAVAGQATPGMEKIARLKTIASDLVLAANNGSLGAGVSNADVEFMKERFGAIGNPDVPANARVAAWKEVKARLGRVAGIGETAKPKGVPVSLPNGSVAYFPSKQAADAFKRKAGIP